jgi:serine protease Do
MVQKIGRARLAAALICVFAAGGIVGATAPGRILSSSAGPVNIRVSSPEAPNGGFSEVVKHGLPAVVSISTSRAPQSPARVAPGREAPRQQPPRGGGGIGSGVIVSTDGYILTNNHVIDRANRITVKLWDRREYDARLVGGDPKSDIAVLKIEARGLPTLAFADSSRVQVGDYALAIGNPFGVGQTVTLGIVSATGRGGLGIEQYEDFIQTDAAINPGNSGGALVNSHGDLIGINTAIISATRASNGVGFAIPSNMAREIMTQLAITGRVTRGYLGVSLEPVTAQMATNLGMAGPQGAMLAEVVPNGPAARGGLQKGDVVLQINGQPIADANQLKLRVAGIEPGGEAKLKILRNGAQRDHVIRVDELPSVLG